MITWTFQILWELDCDNILRWWMKAYHLCQNFATCQEELQKCRISSIIWPYLKGSKNDARKLQIRRFLREYFWIDIMYMTYCTSVYFSKVSSSTYSDWLNNKTAKKFLERDFKVHFSWQIFNKRVYKVSIRIHITKDCSYLFLKYFTKRMFLKVEHIKSKRNLLFQNSI